MSPALSGGFAAEGDWLSLWEASSAFGRGLATATFRDAQGSYPLLALAKPLVEKRL
ncbi:hypothetical protein [Nostoc sp.]|uniref:hypothetical protein n=1 Tax=Nostoc sp. TaxID=1180 RepID=UPI002FF82D1A